MTYKAADGMYPVLTRHAPLPVPPPQTLMGRLVPLGTTGWSASPSSVDPLAPPASTAM